MGHQQTKQLLGAEDNESCSVLFQCLLCHLIHKSYTCDPLTYMQIFWLKKMYLYIMLKNIVLLNNNTQ